VVLRLFTDLSIFSIKKVYFSATISKRPSSSHDGIHFLFCRIREIQAHLNPAGKDGLLSLFHHVGLLPQGNQGPATDRRFINTKLNVYV
jgi:hypothetical protein